MKNKVFTKRTIALLLILFGLIGLFVYLWVGTSYFDILK
jgi:hypothetical protein